MLYTPSPIVIFLFLILVFAPIALSLLKTRRTASGGNLAPPDDIRGFLAGFALAGDFLPAALILGITGLIAFYGYDGFLYSIGLFAGWIAAIFLVAAPLKRLGQWTPAEILASRFRSRPVRLAAAISTLAISLALLVPELIAAGTLAKPLLGLPPFAIGPFIDGRLIIGEVLAGVILIAVALGAGSVSSRWLQFSKTALLLIFSLAIALPLFSRGFSPKPATAFPHILSNTEFAKQIAPAGKPIPPTGPWLTLPFYRLAMADGSTSTWLVHGQTSSPPQLFWPSTFIECETVSTGPAGEILINGRPQSSTNDLLPVSFIKHLAAGEKPAQPLGPLSFFGTLQQSDLAIPASQTISETINGSPHQTTLYFPRELGGADVLTPGADPALFPGIKSKEPTSRLNFFSLMLALFFGAAALPQFISRTGALPPEKSRPAIRIAVCLLALFFILMLYLARGALAAGTLDPSSSNSAFLILAHSSGDWALALVSAAVFLALLASVPDIILAAGDAVAGVPDRHASENPPDNPAPAFTRKSVAAAVGILAILLAVHFENMNAAFLFGWALAIAASANLPAITLSLFWKRITPQGITASIFVGLFSSLAWILLSADAFTHLYGLPVSQSPLPFNQPAIITLPLSFLTLIFVSLFTQPSTGRA